jgi:hypothetical protein
MAHRRGARARHSVPRTTAIQSSLMPISPTIHSGDHQRNWPQWPLMMAPTRGWRACRMVLPVRIERTTSPFITLTLSRPPSGVCVLDHPFAIGTREPVGAARLASTPSRCVGLGSGLPSACPDGFPEFERCTTRSFPSGWAIYQGSALPLSYGSKPPNLPQPLCSRRALFY